VHVEHEHVVEAILVVKGHSGSVYSVAFSPDGYLDQIGITEREPGGVFEKLIDHLAATRE
jgi:hypothetical protein